MDKHIIGENAGVLWRLLNTDAQKKWQLEEIKKGTGLDDMELASAIGGWRERIKFSLNSNIRTEKEKKAYVYLMLNVYF